MQLLGPPRAAALLIAGVLVLGGLVGAGWLRNADHEGIALVQRWSSAPADEVASALAVAGTLEFEAPVVLALATALFVRGRRRTAMAFFLMFPLVLAVVALRLVISQPHPEPHYSRYLYASLPSDLVATAVGGYPSGHVARAAFLAWLVASTAWHAPLHLPFRRAVWGLCMLLALLMVWSRVYIGAHWPSDVAGGLLIGVGGAIWAAQIARGSNGEDAKGDYDLNSSPERHSERARRARNLGPEHAAGRSVQDSSLRSE